MTRDEALALDKADPLRGARDRFALPDGTIYLDGNSLGALPDGTARRLGALVEKQWGDDLIASWNRNDWIGLPKRVAARLSPLLGASADELIIADSTSVCLFKLLAAAVADRPGRSTILVRDGDFPTDIYIAQGLADVATGLRVRAVAVDAIDQSFDEDVAALLISHVDYRSGARTDMAAVERAAQAAGAHVVWDLSHSAGALALDLRRDQARLAVGCGYKYLNGGPGAPAFIYVASELQDRLTTPLPGWMGHADPFAFDQAYRPAAGMTRFLTGTPSVLALEALDCGLSTFDGVAIATVEAKGRRLTQSFVAEVERRCGDALRLESPRDPAARGSHVVFAHRDGYALMQALIDRGVVGDFRAPDLVRFGFAPLYNSFEDAWSAAEVIGELVASGEWDSPRFRQRSKVT